MHEEANYCHGIARILSLSLSLLPGRELVTLVYSGRGRVSLDSADIVAGFEGMFGRRLCAATRSSFSLARGMIFILLSFFPV